MSMARADSALKSFAARWFKGHQSAAYKVSVGKNFNAMALFDEAVEMLLLVSKTVEADIAEMDLAKQFVAFAAVEKEKTAHECQRLYEALEMCYRNGWTIPQINASAQVIWRKS